MQWSYRTPLCAQSPTDSSVKAVLKVSCFQESSTKQHNLIVCYFLLTSLISFFQNGNPSHRRYSFSTLDPFHMTEISITASTLNLQRRKEQDVKVAAREAIYVPRILAFLHCRRECDKKQAPMYCVHRMKPFLSKQKLKCLPKGSKIHTAKD